MFSLDADVFFRSPRMIQEPPGWFGVLHLLRRDIDLSLGIDPNTGASIRCGALWPGAMATLAGIDLLAKFYAGNDETGKVGERFLGFLEAFSVGHTPDGRETIYQLRNSLLHSFGLYSRTRQKVYRFRLTAHGAGSLISHQPPDKYSIDLHLLHQGFERTVAEYQAALDSTTELQTKFEAVFPNYGQVYIG